MEPINYSRTTSKNCLFLFGWNVSEKWSDFTLNPTRLNHTEPVESPARISSRRNASIALPRKNWGTTSEEISARGPKNQITEPLPSSKGEETNFLSSNTWCVNPQNETEPGFPRNGSSPVLPTAPELRSAEVGGVNAAPFAPWESAFVERRGFRVFAEEEGGGGGGGERGRGERWGRRWAVGMDWKCISGVTLERGGFGWSGLKP